MSPNGSDLMPALSTTTSTTTMYVWRTLTRQMHSLQIFAQLSASIRKKRCCRRIYERIFWRLYNLPNRTDLSITSRFRQVYCFHPNTLRIMQACKQKECTTIFVVLLIVVRGISTGSRLYTPTIGNCSINTRISPVSYSLSIRPTYRPR